MMLGPFTDRYILLWVRFLWFLLSRHRALLPHLKVQVMSATTSAYNQ